MLRSWTHDLVSGEELRHIGGHAGQARESVDTRAGQNEAKDALVLVEGLRLISLFCGRADDESGHLSAAVREVGLIALIEGDDQQAATLELGAGDQWCNIALQPGVRLSEATIVGV